MTQDKVYSSILVIPDIHFPAGHPDVAHFLSDLKDSIKPDKVVCLGDILDLHSVSFHQIDPSLLSPKSELELAIEHLQPIYKLFPKMVVTLGNHDIRFTRKMEAAGIPSFIAKDFGDLIEAPKGWEFVPNVRINTPAGEVLFTHALGGNGLLAAQRLATSAVTGHHHTNFSISYWSTKEKLMYFMSSGCLINPNHAAFAYNRGVLRPIIGASMIMDGVPHLISMPLDKHSRYTGKV